MIDRRAFLATTAAVSSRGLLGPRGVIAAAPPRLPVIAVLSPTSGTTPSGGIADFKHALAELGWVEGRTVRFETRFGEWQRDRTLESARELARLAPDVLYTHGDSGARAAMQATTQVPIVVGGVADLVAVAGITSLAHPGGNVTGVTHAQPELDRKRLEVLKEAVPSVTTIGYLFQEGAVLERALQALDESGRQLKVGVEHLSVRQPAQIEPAFTSMRKRGAQAVLVQDGIVLSRYAERVTAIAFQQRVPTISQMPRFAELGGLLQYGGDVLELFRRSAVYVDKILRGAKPGDLPIEQPTKIDFVINLKTATALRLTIPQSLLGRADRIIQ